MNLHELRAFTIIALLGGLAFWPAACYSISTPVRPDVDSRPIQAQASATLSRPGKETPVPTPGQERGNPDQAGFLRSSSRLHGNRGLGEASMAAAEGLRVMATNAANLCGVPVALFHALIERESSWRPHVVSRSGAVGLAQVKPSTGRGVSPGLDVHDPWQNLVAGACFLRRMYDRKGSWRAALRAYTDGPNRKHSTGRAIAYANDIMEGM